MPHPQAHRPRVAAPVSLALSHRSPHGVTPHKPARAMVSVWKRGGSRGQLVLSLVPASRLRVAALPLALALLVLLVTIRGRPHGWKAEPCPNLLVGHRTRFLAARAAGSDQAQISSLQRRTRSPVDALMTPEPLRVLISTGAYNNIVDGVTSTLNLAVAELERRGFEILVIAPAMPAEEAVRAHEGRLLPAAAVQFPMRPEYLLSTGLDRCNEAALSEFDPDLVHVATPDLLGGQVLKWAGEHGLPVACSYHTRFGAYLRYYSPPHVLPSISAVWWMYSRYFYSQCDHVYPPTASVRAELIAKGVGSLDTHRIWPRGIDLSRFNPSHRSEELRREWGASTDTPVLLFVSRLVLEKNTEVYVQTVLDLEARGARFVPVVVGEGPEHERMRAALPHAVFLGFQQGERLGQAYASGDIFFFPSESETWGAVTLEAMASGLVVVVANAPGSTDLVEDGVTGVIIDPEDAAATSAAIANLLASPGRRRAIATNALRLSAQGNLTWASATDMLVDHYHELLRGRAASVAGPEPPQSDPDHRNPPGPAAVGGGPARQGHHHRKQQQQQQQQQKQQPHRRRRRRGQQAVAADPDTGAGVAGAAAG